MAGDLCFCCCLQPRLSIGVLWLHFVRVKFQIDQLLEDSQFAVQDADVGLRQGREAVRPRRRRFGFGRETPSHALEDGAESRRLDETEDGDKGRPATREGEHGGRGAEADATADRGAHADAEGTDGVAREGSSDAGALFAFGTRKTHACMVLP